MKMIFTLLIAICGLIACECPPSANTPKEIIPSEYAKICIFNAVYSNSTINLSTMYGAFLNGLRFQSYTSTYYNIGSGNNMIKCLDGASVFYSASVNLSKDKYYTAIIVGNQDDTNILLLNDSTAISGFNSSLLRCTNAMKFGGGLEFVHSELGTHSLQFAQSTDTKEITAGANNIIVRNEGETIYNLNFHAQAGYKYTLLTYYNPAAANKINLSINIIEIK